MSATVIGDYGVGSAPAAPSGIEYFNADSNVGDNVTGVTIPTFNVGSGSNRYLICGVASYFDGTSPTITATYNSIDVPVIGTSVHAGNTGERLTLLGLAGPSTGSHDVVFTFSDTITRARCGCLAYTGVHQTASTGAYVHDQVSGGPTASTTASSAATELVIAVWGFGLTYTFSSVGGGETLRVDRSTQANYRMGMTEKVGAASTVMSVTLTGDGYVHISAVPIKPA